ncbi:hypothetical protein [Burkholderia ambifaria]|uniref:hypothetical protein n=1 Tax=Burkholderia ambifaria TaxID=152480 RepID=UPI001B939B69|nr:hypothetical protein [Burkholderia ambifaria]MBR7931773.1 hypothetical protein [Burkholderia ambifaria]
MSVPVWSVGAGPSRCTHRDGGQVVIAGNAAPARTGEGTTAGAARTVAGNAVTISDGAARGQLNVAMQRIRFRDARHACAPGRARRWGGIAAKAAKAAKAPVAPVAPEAVEVVAVVAVVEAVEAVEAIEAVEAVEAAEAAEAMETEEKPTVAQRATS